MILLAQHHNAVSTLARTSVAARVTRAIDAGSRCWSRAESEAATASTTRASNERTGGLSGRNHSARSFVRSLVAGLQNQELAPLHICLAPEEGVKDAHSCCTPPGRKEDASSSFLMTATATDRLTGLIGRCRYTMAAAI